MLSSVGDLPATVLSMDGQMHGVARAASLERESSHAGRVQDIAAEVLRLRLVQAQHRQLEAALRSTSEKLQQMPAEKVLHFRAYLEYGLRPSGGVGTLGFQGGVSAESLVGLMECLCSVCEVRLPGKDRWSEELLAATRELLEDPAVFVQKLAQLQPAREARAKKLAPWLLNSDSGWRGALSEAGQCYECIKSWLSSYYQFSVNNNQVQATSELLMQQEHLLHELGSTEGSTGGSTPALSKPATWRQSSGVRRSSSVQSNDSVGSRRSQSPSTDRAANVGLRPSPRPAAGSGRPSGGGGGGSSRESPLRAPAAGRGRGDTAPPPSPRASAQSAQPVRGGSPKPSATGGASPPLYAPRGHASSPARSASPSQVGAPKASPRPQRLGGLGQGPGAPAGGRRAGTAAAAAGAPPPGLSPRVGSHVGQPAAAPGHAGLSEQSRRQNVPGARTRRSPSRDAAVGTGPKAPAAFLWQVRVTVDKIEETEAEHALTPEGASSPTVCPSGSMARSRSLQSITDVVEGSSLGVTPPLSSRGSRHGDPHSARLRSNTQITPVNTSRSSGARPVQHRVSRLSSGAAAPTAPSAGSGGTPAGGAGPNLRRAQGQHSRSSVPLPSGMRRLSPSESTSTIRHSDAGSGGTGGVDPSLGASKSSPALEVRTVHGGRQGRPATVSRQR